MIVLIDNYDSFVHNLGRYLQRLGQPVRVVRNDAYTDRQLTAWSPAALVLSPGPCSPQEAGQTIALVQQWGPRLPILGICLGHQTIAAACGGRIVRAALPVHGRASGIFHDGLAEFHGLPQPFRAARYHSLVVDEPSLPPELTVSARTEDGTVMALRHRSQPLTGWQFHPESVLTEVGFPLLAKWLHSVGLPTAAPEPSWHDEVAAGAIESGQSRYWSA